VKLLRGDGPPLRVGHRGAAALAPENTLDSLRVAVEHGVDAVEFDVLADERDRLVLAHSRLELPEERATLGDALRYLADAGVGAHVDLKQRGLEREVAEALRDHRLLERSLVSSLDHAALRDLRRHEPRLRVGLSYPEDRLGISRYRAAAPVVAVGLRTLRRTLPRLIGRWLDRAGASAAVLHHALVTRAVVERCHARRAAVWAWTVNDAATAARLSDLGADAIITDDPRTLGPGLR
jgi:glycerophosphoryl diester phosphodiesterase